MFEGVGGRAGDLCLREEESCGEQECGGGTEEIQTKRGLGLAEGAVSGFEASGHACGEVRGMGDHDQGDAGFVVELDEHIQADEPEEFCTLVLDLIEH